MSKKPVYIILGATGSGRREVLADLISDGVAENERAVTYLPASATEGPLDAHLGSAVRWSWTTDHVVTVDVPEDADVLFFVTDGHKNPVDQIEAIIDWVRRNDCQVARVLTIVHCQLLEKNPELVPWYDACIHFSDVVLLNRREDVSNKWVRDFIDRYDNQFYPCLFELVKSGRVKNPVMILQPDARRISQVFDEDNQGFDLHGVIIEDEDEDEKDESAIDEDEDDMPKPDPYLVRRAGGRRAVELPEIERYLG
jgi:hypothetical protein